MVTAAFRFYEELNDFLAPVRRKREFTDPCTRAATTTHMIEALDVTPEWRDQRVTFSGWWGSGDSRMARLRPSCLAR